MNQAEASRIGVEIARAQIALDGRIRLYEAACFSQMDGLINDAQMQVEAALADLLHAKRQAAEVVLASARKGGRK
jgi:hypothetical protein